MENKISEDLNGLMHQLENFITTKTVIGEPIHIDNTILVPLIDVSFAAATGSTASNKFVERHKEKERKEAFCLSFFAVFLDETKALCYNKYHKTF